MSFTHLHVHTCYSLLDGAGKIPEMVRQCKELGMDSLAITDHGAMYGVIDFYKECKAQGIKPIIGCEVYLTPASRFDREKVNGEDRYYHLVLLSENNIGYHNLMKIVSRGFTEGFYYKPRIDYETLMEYHEGLIALSACLVGEVQKDLIRNMPDEARAAALKYQEIFGKGNFYLELQDHGYPEQKTVNAGLIKLHEESGIPLVATNDVHYIYKEDFEPHDILLCIQTGKKLSDEDRLRYPGGQFYLKSEEEMRSLFPYAPEAVENTRKIAERCNVDIVFGKYHLPKYETPSGCNSLSYLRKLCESGLKERYGDDSELHRDRLEYELSTIDSMGFSDYFLIVWDYIHYAKTHNIFVGPGRGSAAGSLVSYVIGITDIDPIRYQLIFERFLNPERVTMPDIDVDFEYERRQEVIDYVTQKYGKDRVAQIVTFGTLAARGVVRDVGRVMDISYAKCDLIAKMIPTDLGMTLDLALTVNPALKKLYSEDEETKIILDMSRRLEGLPRHSSTHAAGVVISSASIEEFVPMCLGVDGALTTQFPMTTIEELGLLKMDFLGLRTLTVIKDAIRLTENDQNISIDLDKIDYSDKNVYAMLSEGDCTGVFQLESEGMTSFMKRLEPETLEDIIAGVALYRPGPMDFIPKYIDGKRNRSHVRYDCPEMEPILSPTYGCIVYQEQVMQIVRDLAGYSMGRSDLVRRAMSKKKSSVMEKERKNFVYGNMAEGIEGSVNRGISEDTANHIYDEMIDFAKYAFNKSHAACYAVLSYQTAYLKHYYPAEFYAALMTSFMENGNKISEYIEAVKDLGLRVLPPDVNSADIGFSVAGSSVRYGLGAVRGVGRSAAENIVKERDNNGRFRNFEDFVIRTSENGLNRRAMEFCIQSGALDSFEGNRRQKFIVLPEILEGHAKDQRNSFAGQMTLLDLMEDKPAVNEDFQLKLPDAPEFSKAELLQKEKEAIGIYISGHPLDEDLSLIKSLTTSKSSDFRLDPDTDSCRVSDGTYQVVGGIVEDVKMKTTKRQEQMAFVDLEDRGGSLEAVIFPKVFERFRESLYPDNKVLLRGRAQLSDGADAKLLAEEVVPFSEVKKEIWIQFEDFDSYKNGWGKLEDILFGHSGSIKVCLYLRKEKAVKRLPAEKSIDINDELISALVNYLGNDNVRISYLSPWVLKKRQF